MKHDTNRLVPESRPLFAKTERAMRGSAIIHGLAVTFAMVATLVLLANQAHAQMALGGALGDPCAPGAYDVDGGPPLIYPGDGGPALAVPVCPGQRAPAPGVFLTVDKAAAIAAERTELKFERDAYQQQLLEQPPPVSAGRVALMVGIPAFIIGSLAGAFLAYEFRTPKK